MTRAAAQKPAIKPVKAGAIKDFWAVLTFQHGEADSLGDLHRAFATKTEAVGYAEDYARDVPYDGYEHEIVLFRAVTSFRGGPRPIDRVEIRVIDKPRKKK